MNQDFLDLLHALLETESRFLVVGAYAMAVHGYPRATGDLDILVEASPDNAAAVMTALKEFGAPLLDLTEKDLSEPGMVFQMGQAPRRIDILTKIDGLEFAGAAEHLVHAKFAELMCPVIGIDALIINKRAAARPKDLVDLIELERIKALQT